MHVDPNYLEQIEHITEVMLQSLYVLQPQL